jgi:hypothetical protein
MLLAVRFDIWNRESSDGRSRVYRRVGEQYADACVIQRQSFGGGSVMVRNGDALI